MVEAFSAGEIKFRDTELCSEWEVLALELLDDCGMADGEVVCLMEH